MKNILIIPADFYPNNTGFSNASLNLVNSLVGNCKDLEIHVLTTEQLGNEKELTQFKIIRYQNKESMIKPLSVIFKIMKYIFIKNYIAKNNIDFIMLETNTFTFLQNLLLKKYKNKLAVRIHSTADTEVLVFEKNDSLFKKIQKKQDINFMRNIRYVISTNSYHLDFIKKYVYKDNVYSIWDDKEYFILPNTIMFDESAFDDLAQENYLLSMGKLSRNGYVQKGMQDLIKAVYILKKNNEVPDGFKLKLIGDGEMWQEINRFAVKYNLAEYIEFIKKTDHDETLRLIKHSKAIVLLSRYEGQSMFITEAIALGKPLIITNDNGMKDMIIEGENGYALKSGDYVGASEAIKKIYSLKEDVLTEMGLASGRIYREKFNPKKISETFLDILDMILK